MSLFEFKLKPLGECALPGDVKKSVAWFYITDSEIWMQLGTVRLFESSRQRREKHSDEPALLDYYYARILEDLFLELLPEIAYGVPDDLYQYIDTPAKFDALEQKLKNWYAKIEDATEEEEEIHETVSRFLWYARLDTGYLRFKSRCWFYHVGGDVAVRYDFEDTDEEGAPVWSAGAGEYVISHWEFVAQLEDLLTRFFAAMDRQVEDAVALLQDGEHYEGYEVFAKRDGQNAKTPAEYLWEEHAQRKEFFWGKLEQMKAGNMDSGMDWDRLQKDLEFLLAR